MTKHRKSKFQYSMFKMHPLPKVLRTCWYLSFRQSCRAPQLPNGPPSFCVLIYRMCSEWYQTLPKCSLRISSSIWIWLEDYFGYFLMFWVCGQEDEAVPRELFRDRFLQLTHCTARGEIAIHWDDIQRRGWHPTPVLLPGKSHGPRSLVGCSPWGREESDTTEWVHFHFPL